MVVAVRLIVVMLAIGGRKLRWRADRRLSIPGYSDQFNRGGARADQCWLGHHAFATETVEAAAARY